MMNRLFRIKMFFKRHKLEISKELLAGLKAYIRKNGKQEPRVAIWYDIELCSEIKNKQKEAEPAKPKDTAPDNGVESATKTVIAESRALYQGPPPKREETEIKETPGLDKDRGAEENRSFDEPLILAQSVRPVRKEASAIMDSKGGVASPIYVDDLPRNKDIIGDMIS